MAILLDGKATAAALRQEIAEEVKKSGVTPGLAVILVGDDPASRLYVNNKKKACAAVGFYSEEITLPADVSQETLIDTVKALNKREDIDGILCQLPLPSHLSDRAVIAAIDPKKDVDAFHAVNAGNILLGTPSFLPCTPAGIMELLSRYHIDIDGKRCVVVGRSNIVGKPMALLLLQKNGTVTVCHSHTRDLAAITRTADILVAAVGVPHFITADMVKAGAVVIDVGMNRDENGKLCGDVDFAAVEPLVSAITPVPGGVGPMTIAMLLKNTLTACKNR